MIGSDWVSISVLSVAVIVLVLIPSLLLMNSPELYNVPVQILFSVFLTAASSWLGICVNNTRARREATAKWLPAAEVACEHLLTLSATAERMRRKQSHACDVLDPFEPDPKCQLHTPLRAVIRLQCTESDEKLAILRDGIESSLSLWRSFIINNCDGKDCEYISRRLKECRDRLGLQVSSSDCCEAGKCLKKGAQEDNNVGPWKAGPGEEPGHL